MNTPRELPNGIVITAVAHEGVRVFVDGKPGRFAVVDAAGNVVSSSWLVARELEAVIINREREQMIADGRLRILKKPE